MYLYNVCEEEAKNNSFKLPCLKRKLERVSMYTKDKDRKIHNPENMLSSPGKKKPRLTVVVRFKFDFSVIRQTIEKFYLELKQVCIFNY